MVEHNIKEGMVFDFKKLTSPSDSCANAGSSELYYLISTPAIIHMMIEASSKMLDDLLPKDYITIGTYVDITHENPTLVGEEITLSVKVVKINGNELTLEYTGLDREGIFCKGNYVRRIVNKNKLMENTFKRFSE
jgi:predicted thioesterase